MPLSGLGRLRRFARLLTGNQADADALVRDVFAGYVPTWIRSDPTLADLELVFAELLMRVAPDERYRWSYDPTRSAYENDIVDALGKMRLVARAVYGLTEVENYSVGDVARITKQDIDRIEGIKDAIQPLRSQPRYTILVVDRDEEKGAEIAATLIEAGFEYVIEDDPARVRDRLAGGTFDLIVADDHDDHIDHALIVAAVNAVNLPIVFMRPYYETMELAEEDGTDEVPAFLSGNLVEDVEQILQVTPDQWSEPDYTFDAARNDETVDRIGERELQSISAPIDAEIVDDQLRPAPSDPPASAVSFTALDALRQQHLRNARFQAQEAHSSNAAPRLKSHFDAIVDLLDQPLTESMVLGLSVGVDALTRFLPVIEEEFSRLAATDIASFLIDLQRFTNQFPVSRDFNGEAAAHRPISAAEDGALTEITDRLLAQPDEVVSAELKRDLAVLQQSRARQAGSTISDVALIRSNSNVLKAIAREARRWLGHLASSSGKHASDNLGKLIGAMPTAGALYLLSTHFPVEFAAVATILTWAAKQTKAMTGGDDEDEKK